MDESGLTETGRAEKYGGERVVLGEGNWLRLVSEGTWEFTERRRVSGVVVIVAVTGDEKLLLVEQYRPALKCAVIELPAGLAGDEAHFKGEELAEAARRELIEETGYEAGRMECLLTGPTTSGLASEVVSFFRASRLRRVGEGGGDDKEDIIVHEVPLTELYAWTRRMADRGRLIDPKVFTGAYFAEHPAIEA